VDYEPESKNLNDALHGIDEGEDLVDLLKSFVPFCLIFFILIIVKGEA
jgi:hypothetical protein